MKIFKLLLAAVPLVLFGCLTDGSDDREGNGGVDTTIITAPDSSRVLVPLAEYSVTRRDITPWIIHCDTVNDVSSCSEYHDWPPQYAHVIEVDLDSVSLPRVIKDTTTSWKYGYYNYIPFCTVTLNGILKGRVGTGSSAGSFAVPAVVDSAVLFKGGWRLEAPIDGSLMDSAVMAAWLAGTRLPLPDSLILGGRAATRPLALAHNAAFVANHCGTYWTDHSVQVPDSTGYSLTYAPACRDAETRAALVAELQVNMTPDRVEVTVDSTFLSTPNMTVKASVGISCAVP